MLTINDLHDFSIRKEERNTRAVLEPSLKLPKEKSKAAWSIFTECRTTTTNL